MQSKISVPHGLETKYPMSDPIESVDHKVLALFRELVGERVSRLDGSVLASSAMNAATAAPQRAGAAGCPWTTNRRQSRLLLLDDEATARTAATAEARAAGAPPPWTS